MAALPLNELSATDAAARIRAGELSSEALVRACLERIAAREADVGAWAHLDPDRALDAARAADRGEGGALRGVPVGIKDIIDTVDMPTALGSPIYAGRRPQWDAACVAALRAAGAIVLGKTVTTEFAYFQPGGTRNPHDLRHTPGGSSSGSAAAVADGMVPVALGTQTAGSVVRPAAFCGVFGYKASFGDFSLSGVRSFAESLDTLGILARSVADIALTRNVLMGFPDATTTLALPAAPTLGLCRTAQWSLADACVREAVEAGAESLRRAGARVHEVVLPAHFAALIDAQKTIMACEAARNFLFETTRHGERVSDALRALADLGWRTPRSAYVDAKRMVAGAASELGAVLAGCDALIAPATLGEAPLAAAGTGDPVMNRMWTALHVPCMAVPLTTGPQGLPVALQLVAATGADELLLKVADWASRVRAP
jgi:Asp-tRNA(Asn)/Glu-tRNA(Gln) amidotransferase A subunit family amidase